MRDRKVTWHTSANEVRGGFYELLRDNPDTRYPLRVPHHTTSLAGILGEMALAQGGTLVLDDAPEFRRIVLDAVEASPLPFDLVLLGAPCPCGEGSPGCGCGERAMTHYARRCGDIRRQFGVEGCGHRACREAEREAGETSCLVAEEGGRA